jgi:hypothetical protein
MLDHVIVMNERHLHRLLREYTRKLRFLPTTTKTEFTLG